MRRLYFLVFLTFIIFTAVAKLNAAGPSLIGKWVVKSIEYKYANEPEKDYPLSRDDFEAMVTMGRTFDFKSSGILTLSYLKAENPTIHAYIFDGKSLKYSPQPMSTSEILSGGPNPAWAKQAEAMEVRETEEEIILIQKNESWILRLNLERIH